MAAEWPRDMAAAELAVRLCISSAERQRRMARIGATGPWAVRTWLERLGLWEATQALRVVHVAGTKGKGSTCAMTEACLRAGGLRTGLYSSPHLVSVRERFRVDGAVVAEDVFLRYFWRVWDGLGGKDPREGAAAIPETPDVDAGAYVPRDDVRFGRDPPEPFIDPGFPGFFQLLTMVGFALFSGEGVDVLVLEVGLGGRLDATNVVRAPVATAVTTLDFDHCEILGYTLPQIAREKAGICKAGSPLVVAPQRADAVSAICESHRRAGAGELRLLRPEDVEGLRAWVGSDLALQGDVQWVNAAVAATLARWVFRRLRGGGGGDEEDDVAIRRGLASAQWPGRSHHVLVARRRGTGAEEGEGIGAGERGMEDDRWRVVGQDAAAESSSDAVLSLWLDGAHTQTSTLHAARWFLGGRDASSSLTERTPPQCLVFNCGVDRAPWNLLLPLAAATAWHTVVLAPFGEGKVATTPEPATTDEAVQRFVDTKVRCEEFDVLHLLAGSDKAAGVAVDAAGLTSALQAEVRDAVVDLQRSGASHVVPWTPESDRARLPFQWLIADLLLALLCVRRFAPLLADLRRQLALPPTSVPPAATETLPRIIVAPSTAAAVDALADVAARWHDAHSPDFSHGPAAHRPLRVLATGSLYLVGGLLQAVHWQPL